jgi:hypothetical protein
MKTYSGRIALYFCLTLAMSTGTLRAETRTLTDTQGRSIQADVVEVRGDQVKIRREDGQFFNLSLEKLSPGDQAELKEWAAQEVNKPKAAAPVTLDVQMSRAKFDTEKTERDITLSTGVLVKKGQTITEEKWGYGIIFTNQGSEPLNDLRAEYLLFATIDNVYVEGKKEGLRRKACLASLDSIAAKDRLDFRTETVSAFKTKYNGNIVSAKTGERSSRETLYGIWLRVYRGEELIYENSLPDGLRKKETWPKSLD